MVFIFIRALDDLLRGNRGFVNRLLSGLVPRDRVTLDQRTRPPEKNVLSSFDEFEYA